MFGGEESRRFCTGALVDGKAGISLCIYDNLRPPSFLKGWKTGHPAEISCLSLMTGGGDEDLLFVIGK